MERSDVCKKHAEDREWDAQIDHNPVTRPAHYARFAVEPRDAITAWGLDYTLGSAVKYIARADHKGNPIQDLEKAAECIRYELERRRA